MNGFYLALHGYKLEKAICCSMHKRYIRTPSFRYQWTSCVTPTSSDLSLTSASVPAIYIQQFWNTMNHLKDLRKKAFSPHSLRAVYKDDNLLCGEHQQCEIDEVFGMEIPKPLITEAIQQSSYYPKYLEMVAKNTKKTPQDSASKQSIHGTKHAPPKKLTPGKPSLVDEEDEAQQEPEPQGEGDDPALELAKKLSLDAHQEKGEGEGADADLERAIKRAWILPSYRTQSTAGSDPGQGHEALAGSNLKPMQEDSGPGKEHVTLAGPNPEHMDEDFYATAYPKVHENLKLRTDEHVILENPESSSATLSSMKNLDETDNFGDQFLNDKPTEDDQEKTNVVTSAPPVNAPVMNISSPTPSSQVNAPPINTEATTIITTIPEITPFIALQLRVAKLEQDMSEVKKTDHSAAVLASIQSQVPTVVDKYLETKLDDALLKSLKRHTADLVEKYSVLLALEEQEEKKQEPTYTIKSTDKALLEEFDLKSALFKSMHKNKFANRNPANYRLYHALMEALIEDENAMDKEVADKVKDHKRKHDSDDDEDDDDEGPSAGSNQGDSTKRRKHDSSASGLAQPPFKDSEQSTKNKLDSNTFAAQQPPTHTSSAWQITDTKDTPPGPLMQTTDHQSEQSSDDNPITDEGHVSDPEDTDNAHIPKVPAATWFKPIPEEERPATPEPEWTIPSNDYLEPENNWANVYATTYQDLEENKLQRKTGDI
ncbi:hypothetical protein Tco_0186395 [Tanacetum coccineum]